MEPRFQFGLVDGEPLPPPLSTQPLFKTEEILLFEDFLDNLATENEFLFHSNVPASLSWDGFTTSKNSAFDDIKHSGLQFGSDTHFSKTDGYVATHKFVPPGYGRVHPQSSAQRSQRSSASSQRPSIPPEATSLEPGLQNPLQSPHYTQQLTTGGMASPNNYTYPDTNDRPPHSYTVSYAPLSTGPLQNFNYPGPRAGNYDFSHDKPLHSSGHGPYNSAHFSPSPRSMNINHIAVSTHSPDLGNKHSSDMHAKVFGSQFEPIDYGEREISVSRPASHKKIKLEEGVGKQPLSAGIAQNTTRHIDVY